MPQLPLEIWRRRLEAELEEMKASNCSFTVTKDLLEYIVVLDAKGLVEEEGNVKPKKSHRVRILLKRGFPYPGGIEAAFLSPVFHPNVRSEDGLVCIQLLNEWGETTSVANVVAGLRWLVENPNPASPLNKRAAEYFTQASKAPARAGGNEARKPRIVK